MAKPTGMSTERELAMSGEARWHGWVKELALGLRDEDGFFSAIEGKLAVPIIKEKRNKGHGRGPDGTMMEIPAALRKVATELEEVDVGFGVGGSGVVDLSLHLFFFIKVSIGF